MHQIKRKKMTDEQIKAHLNHIHNILAHIERKHLGKKRKKNEIK